MNPERLLFVLVAVALVTGTILTRPSVESNPDADSDRLREENLARLNVLEDENARLRARLALQGENAPEALTAFVEKDLGMTFVTPPVLFTASEDELFDAARQNLLVVATEKEWSQEETVWQLLGLLDEDQSLGGELLAAAANSPGGIYLLREDRILLPETFSPDSIQDQGTLVRLLAQKAARQLSGLPPVNSTLDRWRAWEAVNLGTALDCEKRYLRRRSAEPAEGLQSPAVKREAALLQLSPAVQALANFPHLGGQKLANQTYLESRAAFTAFLNNPPETTFSILYPETIRGSHPFDKASPGPKEYHTSLGALGLRTLLDPILGLEESTGFAQAWSRDSFYLYESQDGPSFIWTLYFSSPEIAAAIASTFEEIAALHPPDRQVQVILWGQLVNVQSKIK